MHGSPSSSYCPHGRQPSTLLRPLRQLTENLDQLTRDSGVMRLSPRIVQPLRQNIGDRDQPGPLPSDAKPVDLLPHSLGDRARLHRRAFVARRRIRHHAQPFRPMRPLIGPIRLPAHVTTATPPVAGTVMRVTNSCHVLHNPSPPKVSTPRRRPAGRRFAIPTPFGGCGGPGRKDQLKPRPTARLFYAVRSDCTTPRGANTDVAKRPSQRARITEASKPIELVQSQYRAPHICMSSHISSSAR